MAQFIGFCQVYCCRLLEGSVEVTVSFMVINAYFFTFVGVNVVVAHGRAWAFSPVNMDFICKSLPVREHIIIEKTTELVKEHEWEMFIVF